MIRLDEDTHTYYWSGVKVPGVTEVLTRTGIAQYPDTWTLRRARHRGSAVHKAIELAEKGTLDEHSLENQADLAEMKVAGFLDGYKRFKDQMIAKVVRYEMVVGHRIWLYGGKLDQLSITLDGRLVVWDWKSGDLPWWVELQTGAYLEAILSDESLGLESDQLWHGAVQFYPDGSFGIPRLSQDRSKFGIFREALDVVNYTDRRGK